MHSLKAFPREVEEGSSRCPDEGALQRPFGPAQPELAFAAPPDRDMGLALPASALLRPQAELKDVPGAYE